MKRLVWLILVLCVVAIDVAAQDVSRTTTPTANYSPIDYVALMRELERASRPTLWQRLTGGYRQTKETVQNDKFSLTGQVGLGYTQETSAMVVASGVMHYPMRQDVPLSYTSLTGMLSVNGFYNLTLAGVAQFSGKDKLLYNIGGGVMPVRFWGLGYGAAENNARSTYTRNRLDASVQYVRHIVAGLSVGAGVDFLYARAHDVEPLAAEYLQQAGVTDDEACTTGISLMAEYDGRRCDESLTSGYYLRLQCAFHPKAIGDNSTNIWHVEAVANYYQPLWRGAVAAVDLYTNMWSTNTPWLFWARMGGENRMRGYYYGKYTDRKMATAQLELRQHIYGPISGVVWGGAGSVFASHKLIDFGEVLPNYGVGIRIAAANRTAVRIDYGFGRRTNGLVISVNEAF